MVDDSLRPILRNIGQKIANLREDVNEAIGEIKKVRETIKEGVEKIIEAINDNIQAQAELKIMEKLADVRSIPKQIEAEKEQVDMEKEELESKLRRMSERYDERHDELDEKAEERVRDVGEHIFEIQEEEYENGIEEPFTEHVTSTWREMQVATEEITRDRQERLEEDLERTTEEVDTFIERRRNFLNKIDNHRVDSVPDVNGSRPIQIPFWVVTVERDGVEEQEIVMPSSLSN
ncbi:MAG: hypothetical protein SV760_10000, partial [Halobacteria archaeon]|nr:hypothetical protein [Halobacteria archaeon]